jgi:hypothetical protein
MLNFNRIKWLLGILLIFAIVLVTNLVDRKNFQNIKESVVSIYEDRIVASDLIFRISNLIHEKELALYTQDSSLISQAALNAEIDSLLLAYSGTKITKSEQEHFDRFKENYAALKHLEGKQSSEQALEKMQRLEKNLQDLSAIQLQEGYRQKAMSERSLESVELFTKIEIVFLVLISIGAQIFILVGPKSKRENKTT